MEDAVEYMGIDMAADGTTAKTVVTVVSERERTMALNRVRITAPLPGTKRAGSGQLVEWPVKPDFFEAPASSKFHGCYPGGLAQHSLNVFDRLNAMVCSMNMDVPFESVVIAALLHDVCKVGAYQFRELEDGSLSTEYVWNRNQPK